MPKAQLLLVKVTIKTKPFFSMVLYCGFVGKSYAIFINEAGAYSREKS